MRDSAPGKIENQVLSKIAETGDLSPVLDACVTADFFQSKEHQRIFSRMLALKREHGTITLRMLRRDFPSHDFYRVPEPWDYVIGELREEYGHRCLEEGFGDLVSMFTDTTVPVSEIRDYMSTLLKETEQVEQQTLDVDIASKDSMLARIERYEEYERTGDVLLGIPTGFDFIDKATRGIQAKQLITLVGQAKGGKTTTLAHIAIAAHRARKKVLFVTFEMTEEEISRIIDAFHAGVSRQDILRGKMNPEDWKTLKGSMHIMSGPGAKEFIISNDTNSTMTLTGLASKIDDYKPDLLIVDGAYMMHDEHGERPGSAQALTNITRGMKRLAQNKAIPILITTQVLEWKIDRRRGITSNSIGYSSSFGQDSDLIIGVERDEEDPTINILRIVLGRHVPTGIFRRLRWDWERGTFEELPEDEEDDDDESSY